MLPACFINPGDVVLMTVPSYPYFDHAKFYGGEVYNMPLKPENYFPDLKAVPAKSAKAKMMVLNYQQ